MIVLLLYTSLVEVTKIVNVKTPTLAKYRELDFSYSASLTCPCSNISINYTTLFDIKYTLHQVCRSIFVDQNWITSLVSRTGSLVYLDDFRWTSQFTFQALKALCNISDRTIANELIRFYSNQYISGNVIRRELFELETAALIERFRASMVENFLLFLSMIRETTQANILFSGLQNSYEILLLPESASAWPIPKRYKNCSCASSSKCFKPIFIYTNLNRTNFYSVEDFYQGCYVIEALLQSNLRCLYDQYCIDNNFHFDLSSSAIPTLALDSSLPSRYRTNVTFEEIVAKLMIDEWNASSMYERYYNDCQPKECTYQYQTRNDLLYVVTALFSITGGLKTVLELIVPRLIDFVAQLIRKRRATVAPEISVIES